MGKKGLYKQTKGTQQKQKEKKAMFQNVAPAGRESTDPTGDIASGLFLVGMGVICHIWAKTKFTQVLLIMMCVVAVYLVGRGIMALVKQNKK